MNEKERNDLFERLIDLPVAERGYILSGLFGVLGWRVSNEQDKTSIELIEYIDKKVSEAEEENQKNKTSSAKDV